MFFCLFTRDGSGRSMRSPRELRLVVLAVLLGTAAAALLAAVALLAALSKNKIEIFDSV